MFTCTAPSASEIHRGSIRSYCSTETGEEGIRFLLVSGTPLGEPVAWYGPIVMNTQAELQTAFAELDRGTFLGPKTQS